MSNPTSKKRKATPTKKKKPKEKKVRVKKQKASELQINLITGKGKSAKIREPADSTLLDTSIISNTGYIDYHKHLKKNIIKPDEKTFIPYDEYEENKDEDKNRSIKTTITLEPRMVFPSPENQNMNTLTTVNRSSHGHFPDLNQLRKPSYFFNDDDDDDDNEINQDFDLMLLDTPSKQKDGGGKTKQHPSPCFIPNQTIIIKDKTSSHECILDYYPTTTSNKSQYHDKTSALNEIRDFPFEVFAERGYTPKNAYDLGSQIKIMSLDFVKSGDNVKKLREDENDRLISIANKNNTKEAEAEVGGDDNTGTSPIGGGKQPRRKRNSMTNGADTTKIYIPFTPHVIQSVSFNGRTYKNELPNTIHDFKINREERSCEFYIKDQLEIDKVEGKAVYMKPTLHYKMFNDLTATHYASFEKRMEVINDSIKNTPKFIDEAPLSKKYIDSYRRRPGPGDELCSNGSMCLFKTWSTDPNITYVGKVFYTKRERRILAEHIKAKRKPTISITKKTTITSLEDARNATHEMLSQKTEFTEGKEVIKGINNHSKLCIDCLLQDFSTKCYDNISSGRPQETQINHFSVKVEEGEYTDTVMLLTNLNSRPTGIVGYVPRYNKTKRVSVVIQERNIIGFNKFEEKTTNYIAETNMDF
jgi:hypothetical protein